MWPGVIDRLRAVVVDGDVEALLKPLKALDDRRVGGWSLGLSRRLSIDIALSVHQFGHYQINEVRREVKPFTLHAVLCILLVKLCL